MKILVEQKGKKYKIQVLSGGMSLKEATVNTIQERDVLVMEYAQTFNIIDIDMRMQKKGKLSNAPTIPVLSEEDADFFFEENPELTFNRIIAAIEEGLKYDLEVINLFELNGTGVFITSDRVNWRGGLESALEYFEQVEVYEKCNKIQKLLKVV